MPGNARDTRLFETVRLRMLGHTARQIADKLDCSESHIWRIFASERFKEELSRRQDELNAATFAVLTAGAQRAAARMVELTSSSNEAIALRAADLVLSHGRAGREEFVFTPRLDAVELALQAAQGTTTPAAAKVDYRIMLEDDDALDEPIDEA